MLLGLSATAFSNPSKSQAYSQCKKEVKQRYGLYKGSDPGLKQHMLKLIEACMAKYGHYSE